MRSQYVSKVTIQLQKDRHICIKHCWLDKDLSLGEDDKREVERPFLVEGGVNQNIRREYHDAYKSRLDISGSWACEPTNMD
jgi:hypothetical protein